MKLLSSTKDNAKLVWCSGKILEFTIRSMINRQRFMNENDVIIQRTALDRDQIEATFKETIEPLVPMI